MKSKMEEVYIDEDNKVIFQDLHKYLNKLKNSIVEQDKRREYFIQKEVCIRKEKIDEDLLKLPVIYRLKVTYKDTEWKFYLKNYEEVKNKIIEILKNGLHSFICEKVYIFDSFSVELFKVENEGW